MQTLLIVKLSDSFGLELLKALMKVNYLLSLFTKKLRERTRREPFGRAATSARLLAQQLASFSL